MEKNKDRKVEKSLERSKKTTLTFANELAKEGCSALVPGGGLMYEGIRILMQHGRKFYEDRKTERIEKFHEILLGKDVPSKEDILHKEFTIEDYTILLSHAVQDEEDDKVGIYSRIFQALLNKRIPDELKSHILKSSRSLLYSDFEFMKEIYLAGIYEFKDEGNIEEQIKHRTRVKDPIKNLSIQNLIRLGFLYDKDGSKPPYPTDLLKTLISSIFKEDELTPESIGKQAWRDVRIFIASFDINSHTSFINKVANALSAKNIKTIIALPSKHVFVQSTSELIILINDNNVFKQIETYKKENHNFSSKIINAYLPGTLKEFFEEQDDKTFFFKTIDDSEIVQFVEFIVNKLVKN
jgi:hypothetical protein